MVIYLKNLEYGSNSFISNENCNSVSCCVAIRKDALNEIYKRIKLMICLPININNFIKILVHSWGNATAKFGTK